MRWILECHGLKWDLLTIKRSTIVGELTDALSAELIARGIRSPSLVTLDKLFEGLYFSSLRTEEARRCTLSVVYINPRDPDPAPPPRIRQDRWRYISLEQPLEWTDSNISKIAQASYPRTSSFAVYPGRRGRLMIWGLVDQQNRYHDFVNYHAESGPQRPGVFQVETVGVGNIRVSISYERIAELKINRPMDTRLAVFEKGPIWDRLEPGIVAAATRLQRRLQGEGILLKAPPFYSWTTSLCRLILRIQNYKHGGALLITPDTSFGELKIRHPLQYTRLRTAIENRLFFQELDYRAYREARRLWQRDRPIPADLHLDQSICEDELKDALSELDGAIWFVSLLSRVDGLVLLTPQLDVVGFGVEINASRIPSRIFTAARESGSFKSLRPLDYEKFGTRHRSMIRYCAAFPKSVGMVISQDGDVRAITSTEHGVVVWENIKLQLDTRTRRIVPRDLVAQRRKEK